MTGHEIKSRIFATEEKYGIFIYKILLAWKCQGSTGVAQKDTVQT